jgi:peptidoglycan/xylan/chitin deacetylase (PgdA/CDA1 family)
LAAAIVHRVRVFALVLLASCVFAAMSCGGDAGDAPEPSPTIAPRVLTRGDEAQPAVALIFEVRAADTAAGDVAEILAALDAAGVRAGFAITGRWAEANVELTRAIAADGHLIINAGYDGESFTGQSTGQRSLSFEDRSLQLSRTETTVYRITNRTTQPFFRPPLGDLDVSVERDAAALGYPVTVAGSLDARGAVDAPGLAVVVQRAANGDIIVFSAAGRSPVGAALSDVIAQLRDNDFGFVTLDAMVR